MESPHVPAFSVNDTGDPVFDALLERLRQAKRMGTAGISHESGREEAKENAMTPNALQPPTSPRLALPWQSAATAVATPLQQQSVSTSPLGTIVDDDDEEDWFARLRALRPAPTSFTVPKRGEARTATVVAEPTSPLFSTAAAALRASDAHDYVILSHDDARTLERERDLLLTRSRSLEVQERGREEDEGEEDAMDMLLETMRDEDSALSLSASHSLPDSAPSSASSGAADGASESSTTESFALTRDPPAPRTTSLVSTSPTLFPSLPLPASPAPLAPSSRFRTPTPKHVVVRTSVPPSPFRTPFKTPASTPSAPSAHPRPYSATLKRTRATEPPASPYTVPRKRPRHGDSETPSPPPPTPPLQERSSVPLFDLTPPSEPRITLRALVELHDMFHDAASVLAYGVSSEVVEMTSISAAHFRFVARGEELGPDELYAALLAEGARASSEFTLAWTRNAWRWVVWKLASLERRLPHVYRADRRLLTLERVRAQLAYRYERECVRAQRPALRRLVERDSPAALHLVLLVAAIVAPNVIEVSDGWYGLRAELDAPLAALLARGRIFPGLKLHVLGVELIGPAASEALAVLQASESDEPVLRLRANRVVRARWDTRLGLQRRVHVPRALQCVSAQGGSVQCLELRIEARYPLLFLETLRYRGEVRRVPRDLLAEERRARAALHDETIDLDAMSDEDSEDADEGEEEERREFVTRSEHGEARAAAAHEALLQRVLAAHYESRLARLQREATLTERAHMEHVQRVHEELERVRERCQREVVPLLELRCSDAAAPGRAPSALRECLLRVWSPPTELLELRVGQVVRVYDVEPPRHSASSSRSQDMLPHGVTRDRAAPVPMLHCSRRTQWRLMRTDPLVAIPLPVALRDLTRMSSGDEFDALGILLAVSERVPSERRALWEQRAFVCDVGGSVLCVVWRRHMDDFPTLLPAERTLWSAPGVSAYVAHRHVAYAHWDTRAAWHVADAGVHSELVRAEQVTAWQSALTRLRRWREVSEDVISAALTRVQAILS